MMRHARSLLAVPILAAFLASGAPAPAGAEVGVNFNVHLGPPPVLVAPPADLVLIPGTSIYFIPGISADIFFYDGYWWAPRGPQWYRAYSPRGPWVVRHVRAVPGPLYRVPRDYRVVYGRAKHIPYGHWKKRHGDHWAERRHDRDGRHDRDRDHDRDRKHDRRRR